ncbi:MAG: methyltransferase domain-containing protein [Candidatus Paceibacterota bacterium]|jgi:SAM-dependent methyltransferase
MTSIQIIDSVNYYDRTAKDFDQYSNSKINYLRAIDNLILKEVAPGKTIIDVGSGSGTRISRLVSFLQPKNLLCIDSSEEMIRKCLRYELPAIKYDISDKDLKKHGEFDAALCLWNVLGHVNSTPARKLALQYIYNNLNPDGRLIIDVNNRYNIKNYGLKNVVRNFLFDKLGLANGDFDLKLADDQAIITRVHVFTENELVRLLKETGFKIIKIYFFNYQSGNEEKNSRSGQIAIIARKP